MAVRTYGGLAALLLALWAMAAQVDQQAGSGVMPPAPAEAVEEPPRWKQPDPRTLTAFPGP